MSEFDRGICWLRRDLRLADHAPLAQALTRCRQVWCVFIFDRSILDPLIERGQIADRRVEFIHASAIELDARLRQQGSGLITRRGDPCSLIPHLAAELGVDAVFAGRDYEPQAVARDEWVGRELANSGRQLITLKDQVVFEADEVLTQTGHYFSVFTAYQRAWLKRLTAQDVAPAASMNAQGLAALPRGFTDPIPSLSELGFSPSNLRLLGVPTGESGAATLLDDFSTRIGQYRLRRDFPAVKGPSYLSVHLRFGTVSCRALVRLAQAEMAHGHETGAQTWLSELVWRDFYAQILYHRPDVVAHAFRPEYDAIPWERGDLAEQRLNAWCAGQTGYPLVDAAMHQINHTGYMHNRLRMIAASFLVKDLGIDWRLGADYFALHLIDFDLASNNGGWQWAASTGCDAQPYFRIFNPVTQSQKFDPEGKFIRRYLPVLAALPNQAIHFPADLPVVDQQRLGVVIGRDYPAPIVEHGLARTQTLARFALARGQRA